MIQPKKTIYDYQNDFSILVYHIQRKILDHLKQNLSMSMVNSVFRTEYIAWSVEEHQKDL